VSLFSKKPEPKKYYEAYSCHNHHITKFKSGICTECGEEVKECVALGRIEVHDSGYNFYTYLVDAEFVRWK